MNLLDRFGESDIGKLFSRPAARPSMEAYGIDVFATVRKHGFGIDVVRNQDDPRHYFGIVLLK